MPTYRITDPQTGRVLRVTGDSPPTEPELVALFQSVRQDAPAAAPAPVPETPAAPERTWGDTAADVAIGAAKGVGNTVYGLGKLVHDYTPIGRISDAIQPGAFDPENKPAELTPTNTPQKVGYYGEQVAEFMAPTGAPAKLARAAEVAKSGALGLAQSGGDPIAGGVSAGVAAIPGGAMLNKAAGAFERSAQKEMAQALGAAKEWAKVESAKLAPEMLKRGIGGSRAAMLDLAKSTSKRVGANLDEAYKAATAAGETVPSDIIAGNVQLARDALQTHLPSGARVTIPGTEAVVQRLDALADFVQQMGPDIPVDKAAHIKRTWDKIVDKAGLFGAKSTSSATDNANAWAIREASNSFRDLLNTNPTIAALNKESAFWTGLKKVLKETEKRTQSQRGGLTDAVRGTGGAVAGAMMGGPLGAGAGQLVTTQLSRLTASPAFRTLVSARAKKGIADALASGITPRIAGAVQAAMKELPPALRQEFAQ